MIEQGSGSLIAIGSIVGKRPLAGRSTYAAAKLGVIGLVRTLAVELGPHGVRVKTICPGAVSGPRLDGVFRAQARAQGVSEEEFRAEFSKMRHCAAWSPNQRSAMPVPSSPHPRRFHYR